MRRFICTTAVVLSSAAAVGFASARSAPPVATAEPAIAAASTYQIDAVHSTALFRVQHLGAGQFWGRFNDISGTIDFDEQGEGLPSFDVTIKTESVDTNSEGLEKHLKSPDFFNAKEFPTMTFKSEAVKSIGDGMYEVTGDLTLRGTTKQINAKLEWTGTASMGMGKRCGFEATFTINRSDFGVAYGVENGMVGDETKVIVGLESILPTS